MHASTKIVPYISPCTDCHAHTCTNTLCNRASGPEGVLRRNSEMLLFIQLMTISLLKRLCWKVQTPPENWLSPSAGESFKEVTQGEEQRRRAAEESAA